MIYFDTKYSNLINVILFILKSSVIIIIGSKLQYFLKMEYFYPKGHKIKVEIYFFMKYLNLFKNDYVCYNIISNAHYLSKIISFLRN